MSTYTTGIPGTGQSLNATRDLIQDNFTVLDDTVTVNHIAMNSTGAGKHKFLQMPDQGSAPTTAANESGFYGKAVSGVSNLFARSESDGSEYQLTSFADADIATLGAQNPGWTFLPGGILLQWGVMVVSSATSGIGTLARTMSAAPYSATLTQTTPAGGVLTGYNFFVGGSTTQVTATFSKSISGNFAYIVIGPA